MWSEERRRWFLVHNNAYAHSTITVKYFLANCRMVNASWLFLFPKLKTALQERWFQDAENVNMSQFCATFGQDIKDTLQSRVIILKENKKKLLLISYPNCLQTGSWKPTAWSCNPTPLRHTAQMTSLFHGVSYSTEFEKNCTCKSSLVGGQH